MPNNLVEDEEFLANDLVPTILRGLHIRDDTGALADALVDKYMVGADMGNFTSMTPGNFQLNSFFFIDQ